MKPTKGRLTTIIALGTLFTLLIMTGVLVWLLNRDNQVEKKEIYWVLWVRYERVDLIEKRSSQSYRFIEVYPTPMLCDEAKENLWKEKYEIASKALKAQEGTDKPQISPEECCTINTFVEGDWFTDSRYFCLPDDINPQKWGR